VHRYFPVSRLVRPLSVVPDVRSPDKTADGEKGCRESDLAPQVARTEAEDVHLVTYIYAAKRKG